MKKKVFLITIILFCFSVDAQEPEKDTLFFKYDKKYIEIYNLIPDQYYLKDSNDDGPFFFKKKEIYYGLSPKKIYPLKKFVRRSKFYNRKKHRKLNDYRLYEYFRDYIIFLVRRDEFIKVNAGFEIE